MWLFMRVTNLSSYEEFPRAYNVRAALHLETYRYDRCINFIRINNIAESQMKIRYVHKTVDDGSVA
jgi:hypothetical protein